MNPSTPQTEKDADKLCKCGHPQIQHYYPPPIWDASVTPCMCDDCTCGAFREQP